MKYQSVVHLIEALERFAAQFPETLSADVTAPARALLEEAERKRFLNG